MDFWRRENGRRLLRWISGAVRIARDLSAGFHAPLETPESRAADPRMWKTWQAACRQHLRKHLGINALRDLGGVEEGQGLWKMWSVFPERVSSLYTFFELRTAPAAEAPDRARARKQALSGATEKGKPMPSQTNRTALRQLEKTDFLVVSARTQKPTVNAELERLGAEIVGAGPGEAPQAPDWNQLQEWGITALENSAEEIRTTDRDLQNRRVRLSQARQERDEKRNRIDTGHRALRRSFGGTYGAESLPLVGLDAEPAKALVPAREQMRTVVDRMRDPQLTTQLPAPLAGQKPIELEELAGARDSEITDLEDQMGEVDELRKQTDEALVARDAALARNRRVYSNVGRVLEGVYRLAGLDELADRIRATVRTARRKVEEEPVTPEESKPDSEQEVEETETTETA